MGKRRKKRFHITTKGDLCFPDAGSCVWEKAGKKIHWHIQEGQPVVYKTDETGCKGVAVDCTTLRQRDLKEIQFGVGHSSNQNGIVDGVRHISVGKANWCNIDNLGVSSPKCGSPSVEDFYFGCIKCDQTYTVNVGVIDNQSMSYTKYNNHEINFSGSYTTNCDTCDDCPTGPPSCDEVVCGLVDRLNGEVDLSLGGDPYPDYKAYEPDRPFRVVKLHNLPNSSKVYCLKPVTVDNCSCKKCNGFDAVVSATIFGETIEFKGNLDPSSSAHTMRHQLQSIVDQINEAFVTIKGRHAGHAYLTGGSENIINCCPTQIHVNTCDPDFAIDGLTPAEEYNPFDRYACSKMEPVCQDCDSKDDVRNFSCGLRVISAPIKGDCNCYLTKPLSFYGRKVRFNVAGCGWTEGYYTMKTVQRMEQPRNFGTHIQWQEMQQTPGGKGRKWKRGSTKQGIFQLPSKDSRVVNAPTAVCGQDYCSFYAEWTEWRKDDNLRKCDEYMGYIHVPTCDKATMKCIEDFYAKVAEFNPECNLVEAPVCKGLDCTCSSAEDGCDVEEGVEEKTVKTAVVKKDTKLPAAKKSKNK